MLANPTTSVKVQASNAIINIENVQASDAIINIENVQASNAIINTELNLNEHMYK